MSAAFVVMVSSSRRSDLCSLAFTSQRRWVFVVYTINAVLHVRGMFSYYVIFLMRRPLLVLADVHDGFTPTSKEGGNKRMS